MTRQCDQTILLVEDEAIITVIHKKILSKYGFDVITADTGEKAIEIVELNHEIDLVLMDINLGEGIDGTEAAEEILKIRNIPLVFLSSHTEPEVVNKTEGITSYGYIVKNSGETVLMASIRMAFKLFDAHIKNEIYNRNLEKTNEELIRSENEYRTLFENTGSGIIVIEEDTTISLANDIFAARLGYTRDEIENVKKWTELVHEDDLDRMLKQHRLRRDDPDKADSSYEFRFKARSGEYMNTLLFISMLPGTSRSIASLIDITDNKTAIESAERYRMKLEAAYEELEATNEEMEASMQELADTSRDLQESELKFRSLAESGPVAIMMYQDDKWIYANPAAEKMSGYSKEELLDMNFWDFVAPEHQSKVKETGQVRQRNLKSDPDYEFKIISKEGL